MSQRPALAGGRAAPRPVYAESLFPLYHFGWSALYSASDDRLHFIDAPRPELYDVRADPGQKLNLAAERAPTVAAMRAFVDAQDGGRFDEQETEGGRTAAERVSDAHAESPGATDRYTVRR